jgi:putative spermidine/putrescine transport system ATP-binding protein
MSVSTLSPNAAPEPVAETTRKGHLRLEGVTKRYNENVIAVHRVDLDLERGRLLGLLGPSGCGKTTTLRMIAGLLPITEGRILVDDEDISHAPPHRRDFGLVFQNYALFPHLTVAENVAFGLDMRKVPRAETRERVHAALEMVRLPGYGERRPKEMSGGQQQRVALARALVIRPRILLLDEPLSNLDAKLRDEMRTEIREIQQRLGITTVFVTHDQVEALTMCDMVGVMSHGRLEQLGTPEEIYERPASLFVADFVGRTNTIDCELVEPRKVRIGDAVFGCAANTLPLGPAKAAIRPHRISLTPSRDRALLSNATNGVAGRVARVTYVGDLLQYDVEIGGTMLQVEAPTKGREQAISVGDRLLCEWSPDDMLIFAR